MALWNTVTTGYDGEDETVNFGARAVLEKGDSVFETQSVATVCSQGEVLKNPNVIAATFRNGKLCLAIEQCLHIFSDGLCSNLQFKYTFDSSIQCLSAFEDSFIFLGTGNIIHCLYSGNKDNIIFTRTILTSEENSSIVNIFINRYDKEVLDILIVMSSGQVCRINNFNDAAIIDTLNKECAESLKEVTDIIEVKTIRCGNGKNQVTSAGILYCNGIYKIVLLHNNNFITILKNGETDTQSLLIEDTICKIKIVKVIPNSSLIICLTEDDKFLLLCSHTFICLSLWDHSLVKDFVIRKNSSINDSEVLLLSKPDNEGNSFLQLLTLPGLEKKFQIPVSQHSFLVAQHSTQEVLFIGGITGINNEIIESLCVRILIEKHPSDRFTRLVQRCKFDEAISFALRFNLNVELVYKEQVKHYVQLIQAGPDPQDSLLEIEHFINLLNNIQDVEFICEVCVEVLSVNLNKTEKLLDYAYTRLKKPNVEEIDTLKIRNLEAHLYDISLRLDTFHMIHQASCENFEWYKFSRDDLFNVCKKHVQRGELNHATLIWARHWESFRNLLNEVNLDALINALPIGLKYVDLMAWLKTLIPSVLLIIPQSVYIIVNWAVNLIRSLEFDKTNWPKSGLDFAEQMLRILHQQEYSNLEIGCSVYRQQIYEYTKDLSEMKNALKLIQDLKENYRIHITLADFTQTNKKEVVKILLKKIIPSDIKFLLTFFLRKFIRDCGLEIDIVLSDCVQDILNNSSPWWYYNSGAPWEFTVDGIISCIRDNEIRIKCIISVLKNAHVPWSSTMLNIAKTGLKIDHHLTSTIMHEQKMMEVKVIQKKYGLSKYSFDKYEKRYLIKLIQDIIKQENDNMLEDVMKFALISTEVTNDAYMLCIDYYLRKNDKNKILEMFDSLKSDQILICYKRLILKAQSFLSCKTRLNIYKAYLDALVFISSRYEELHIEDLQVADLKNINILEENCNIHIVLEEYNSVEQCLKILNENIQAMLKQNKSEFEIYNRVRSLSMLLKIPPEEGVLKFVNEVMKTNNIILGCNVFRCILDSDINSDLANKKLFHVANNFLERSCVDEKVNAVSQLMYSLFCTTSTHCKLEHLTILAEILHRVYTVNYLTVSHGDMNDFEDVGTAISTWNFTPLFKNQPVLHISDKLQLFLRELSRLHHLKEEDVTTVEAQLEEITRQLHNWRYDKGTLRLLCVFNYLSLVSHSVHKDLEEVEKTIISTVNSLLDKVISARQLDLEYGLALLVFIGINKARSWLLGNINIFIQDYRKLDNVSQLGIFFYKLYGFNYEQFENIHKKCTWAKKLAECKIPNIQQFIAGDQISNMLNILMYSKQADISLILSYCSDFKMESEECLLQYLSIVLLAWEPEFDIEKTVDGKEILNIKNVEKVALICQELIKIIKNKNKLKGCLVYTFDKLNSYNYEMYIYIIELLIQVNASHHYMSKKSLLLFLKEYKRDKAPDQEELDNYLQNEPYSSSLLTISQWRLPFSPFIHNNLIWKILTAELNLNTYKKWIRLSKSLGIDENKICSIAVNNSINRSNLTCSEEWSLISENSKLLSEVEECVNNMDNLEMATACFYLLANNIPNGADKVTAARLCYNQSLKWTKNISDPKVNEYFIKIRSRYLKFVTTHILYEHNLGISKYLKLVCEPSELMTALYEDPCIIKWYEEHSNDIPDINSAVEKLASIYEINYLKFCYFELNKRLQSTNFQSDETYGHVKYKKPSEVNSEERENILRASYILRSGCGDSSTEYLVTLAFKEEYSVLVQLRSLQCLLITHGIDKLEKLCARNSQYIRQRMKNLKYVCDLKLLQLNFSLTEFESCNKLQLIKDIWNLHYNNPFAPIVMARLCIEYDIHQFVMWELILKQMLKFSLIRELEEILPIIDRAVMAKSSVYIETWQSLILMPFKKDENEDACIHSLTILQACPVLHSLDLNKIIECCLQSSCPHLAVLLLPFMKYQEVNIQKKRILASTNPIILLEKMKDLSNKGIFLAEKVILLLKLEEDGVS